MSLVVRSRLAKNFLPYLVQKRHQSSSLATAQFVNGVRTVTMTSGSTMNALSLEMMCVLEKQITTDAVGLRCVVIKGDGKAFSAGHNLKEMTSKQGREFHLEIFKKCNELMMAIVKAPVPIIAAVDGVAAAAGCQLVAMCDMAVATEKSSFSVPGSNVGLFCSTPGIPLARNVPRKVSSYMLFTGNSISAQEALNFGLVSRLAKDTQDLDKEVDMICEAVKAKPKAVIALGKRFYHRQLDMSLNDALNEGGKVMVNNLGYKDCQEGIKAFIEKRKPKWSHTDDKVH